MTDVSHPFGTRSPARPNPPSGSTRSRYAESHRHSGIVAAPASNDRDDWAADGIPYRFVLLGEIVDFALLRRHLGLRRAEALVVDVAQRIQSALPDAGLAVAGRSLIEITLQGASFDESSTAVARIQAAFGFPLDLDGEAHVVRLRIGGAGTAGLDCDDVRLVEAAELALRDGREQGRDLVRDIAAAAASLDPMALMKELPGAIERGEIFLQYQPKVHVRRQRVASAEALVRWQHPSRGLILPGDFIEAAERSSAIGALTLWTLHRVIADQRALAEAGHDFPIFINISGVLLADKDFVRQACAIVQAGHARIGFEITETAVIRDPESAIAHLKMFADIGVCIAIDDYGAGLSSLAYLKRLPARELKIDKLFVTQLTSSNRDPLIVRSTIDLAHALDMEVTAEGVETPAAMALLSVMGCDQVQGYLISRPIAIDAFRHFLDEDRHLDAVSSPRLSFRRTEQLWKTA